jgi:hypothetical protein
VTVTPGVSYSAGQSIDGLFRLKGAMGSRAAVMVASALIRCQSVQTAGFRLYLFAHKPNSAFVVQELAVLDPEDAKLLCGRIQFSNPDSALGVSLYQATGLHLGVVVEGSLSALHVPTAAVMFMAADDLSIELDLAV